MKTIAKVILVFAFVAFANTLYAIKFSNLRVELLPLSAENAVVEVSTLSDSNFKITVVDDKNQVVFTNENAVPSNNYQVQYDHSNLSDGDYKLTVVSGDLTTERLFRKDNGAIKVGKEKMILKPYFGYNNGIVSCSYINFSKEFVTFSLLKDGQVLYTKDLGNPFNMSEGVNLSQSDLGDYTAVLSAGGKEYSYQIDKKE